MSWTLSAAGTPADVSSYVSHAEMPTGDPSQMLNVKTFLLDELDAWPAGSDVRLRAFGDHDHESRHLVIEMQTIRPRADRGPAPSSFDDSDDQGTPQGSL